MPGPNRGHGLHAECRVLLVHGLLHLLGFDHEEGEEEAAEMAAHEEELLTLLTGAGGGLVSSSLSGLREYDEGFIGGSDGSSNTGGSGSSSSSSSGGSGGESASSESVVYPATMSGSSTRQADCLVLDLDGTLLNEECVITPRTAEALRAALAAGVQVLIATGKARPAAIRAAGTARLDGPGGIVSHGHPGVFLQGLDVYGRAGAALYKVGRCRLKPAKPRVSKCVDFVNARGPRWSIFPSNLINGGGPL